MNKGCLLVLLSVLCFSLHAQSFREYKAKTFNWGGKIGFNSSVPTIDLLTINGTAAEDIQTEYKVGFMASLFCRINIDKFFIQPGISWHHTESTFSFELPSKDNIAGDVIAPAIYEKIKLKNKSVDVPVMIGYNIVKQGPYALSLMVGPKIKYNYETSYSSETSPDAWEHTDGNTPFGINFVAGIGVSVWRLFFDFNYELGLNKTESNFNEIISSYPTGADIRINKRSNMMSFSLGFLF